MKVGQFLKDIGSTIFYSGLFLGILGGCIAAAVLLNGCQNIPYKADTAFTSSAQAGRYEFPIEVNDKPCKDVDGNLGACVKQLRSDETLVIRLPARPYAYRLDVTCSMPLGINYPVDVEAGKAYEVRIPPEIFEPFLMFTCKGEGHPHDREQTVSSAWHVRILVFDAQYQSREVIHLDRGHLILGAFARYATVCDGRGCRQVEKKTVVPVSGDQVRAFSESEVMRWNSYGF